MKKNIFLLLSNQKDYEDFKSELKTKSNLHTYYNIGAKLKDDNSLSFNDWIMYDLYSIYNSDNFYSHYHNVIERKTKNIVRLIFRYFFWQLFKKKTNLFKFIYKKYVYYNLSFWPSLIYRFNNRYLRKYIQLIENSSVILFCNTLMNSEEINFLRASILLNKKNGIFTRNWDNPSSKTFIYPKYFSFVISWSEQMDEQYKKLFEKVKFRIYRYTSPRFNYIKNLNSSHNKNSDNDGYYILYAGCQKMINHEINLLNYLSSELKIKNSLIKIIYRPHPWNKIKLDTFDSFLNQNKSNNILLDPSIKKLITKFKNKDFIPIYQSTVNTYLTEVLKKSKIIITPGGTLALEAGLLSKPVIADLSFPRQVTQKLFIYLDHFNEYAKEDWIYPCFSYGQILKTINEISNKDIESYDFKNINRYADFQNSMNLNDILQLEI